MLILTAFINAAMRDAKYKILEDGTFWGEIPICPGVWANTDTLEKCRDELQEVLEEWICLMSEENQDAHKNKKEINKGIVEKTAGLLSDMEMSGQEYVDRIRRGGFKKQS